MSSSLIDMINDLTRKYTFYSVICLLTIGLINNLSLIVIFVKIRSFRGNQSAFFFTVESTANLSLLLSTFLPYVYKYISGQDLTYISIVWCKLQNALNQIFGLGSLFTICFLTFDQFISTNPRSNWRQISKLKLAHRLTFCNVCFVVLHSIPFIIFTEIRQSEGCTIFNAVLYAYFTFFYYPILNFAIPFIVTITFSVLAYRNVRRIIRRQINIIRRRLDRQMTAMVLARVFCLIILGLPYIIYSLYVLNLTKTANNQLTVAISSFVGAIAYSLLYMNFSINLFLYLIISSRFRRQVKHFLLKRYIYLLNCLCGEYTHNRHTNRVVPQTTRAVVSSIESV